MSVQIDEVEIVPREPRRTAEQPPESTRSGPPQPDLAQVIETTVALLRSRDLRLDAD